ncbi:MAG TPA: type III-B CRISPR-associated protein Cas10/Cmr2 [Desulfosporosinus sp.]|nr:type III-B CRISPR-associated protein Cas10/Cmr2 [Desulfosporosinus sp.]
MPAQQYLFLFTIGPVQSFIAQARKTRDLYAGSKIISDLIDAAIVAAGKEKVIFPDKDSDSKPNRFLAKVFSEDIQDFGKNIENSVRRKWVQIAAEVFKTADLSEDLRKIDEKLIQLLPFKSCVDVLENVSSIAVRQIIEFPDIYWAAIEYNEGDDYKSEHDELNRLLGGVRNVRKFCQLDEHEGSRKCSLDGERTALFYRETVDVNGKNQKPNFLSEESSRVRASLDSGEALSAVSLVKRFYQKSNIRFPSTAQVALMHIINDSWYSAYNKCFKGEVDYQLFYEENLTEKNLEKQGIDKKPEYDLESIITTMRELIKEKQATKYYALLMFDGDDFGKIWSGDMLNDCNQLEHFHQELAKRLHDYAQAARECLDEPKGKTVYTGGDDFLGFVNLNYLFALIGELRVKFDELVSLPLSTYLKEGHAITFTAGMAIAHYKAPLGEVINKARSIEEKAKRNIAGKDGFGIAIMKHSGEMQEAFLRFYPKDLAHESLVSLGTLTLLREIVDNLKSETGFSNTFIKSFGWEMRQLMDKKGFVSLSEQAIRTEFRRLLDRSSKKYGQEKDKAVQDFLKIVDSLWQVAERNFGISNFLSLLDICDFIKRETSRN